MVLFATTTTGQPRVRAAMEEIANSLNTLITRIDSGLTTRAASLTESLSRNALDAAHKAKDAWGRTSAAERAQVLMRIAQVMEDNLDKLALVEAWCGRTVLAHAEGLALNEGTIVARNTAVSDFVRRHGTQCGERRGKSGR